MADDNTIIEGTVKFRDGKKWKSRWCVMRKLSPVADCVHLQLYRDSRGRWGGAGCKAALSLQHYLGCELGFTLDKHSNTLALVCRDLVAILAFETRERLIQWQVKVSAHLGEARHYLVLVGSGGGGKARLPPGPARLHLHERRFALTAGVPPRLLGIWELAHLRRYGVVEGRFCFEGGSYCGKGEGLHVLITDQAKEVAADFDLASQGRLSPKRRPLNSKKTNAAESPKSHKAYRPDTRLSELKTIDQTLSPTDIRLYEDPRTGEEAGAISPYWPSAERTHFQDMGHGDTASVNETMEGTDTAPWSVAGNVSLERCMSCISKLGALSRSSTAALTPGAKHFSPAWTMDALEESFPEVGPSVATVDALATIHKTEEVCRCPERPLPAPDRPPKPTRLDLNLNKKPAMPLPAPPHSCTCSCVRSLEESKSSKIGPYENYDVPKLASVEVDGDYYDTPKRLKECLNNELFKITKSSTSNAVILKKPCGCLLKFGKRRKEPTVIDTDENIQPASCPCQRVTDWANNWIRLPYCKKNTVSSDNLVPNKENMKPNSGDHNAIYATIDVSRKTRRKTHPIDPHELDHGTNPQKVEIDRGPLANYENLNFALSLEYYENAKDLLVRAGVTQAELDAISANLRAGALTGVDHRGMCTKCGHPPAARDTGRHVESLTVTSCDDYLMMEPKSLDSNKQDQCKSLPPGYTPMSPIGGFAFNTLKHPVRSPINRLLEEKSASNPTLCVLETKRNSEENENGADVRPSRSTSEKDRIEYRKRSSSADSSRFLEDVKEFEGSVGSRGSGSSIETLRDAELVPAGASVAAPCRCAREHKHSDAESSEASKGRGGGSAGATAAGGPAGNRDSSSSNDSGVSSCSLRPTAGDFELPLTTAAARRHYRCARRATAVPRGAGACYCPPRRSRSTDPLQDGAALQRERIPAKSSSAEAEVPVLAVIKPLKGVVDTHSTSSGTSDMSDYIETLSICSSHSSTDTPITMRVVRQTSTLRPRSGKEYGSLDPRLTSVFRASPSPAAPHPPPRTHRRTRPHSTDHARTCTPTCHSIHSNTDNINTTPCLDINYL